MYEVAGVEPKRGDTSIRIANPWPRMRAKATLTRHSQLDCEVQWSGHPNHMQEDLNDTTVASLTYFVGQQSPLATRPCPCPPGRDAMGETRSSTTCPSPRSSSIALNFSYISREASRSLALSPVDTSFFLLFFLCILNPFPKGLLRSLPTDKNIQTSASLFRYHIY